jgi:hypothetical protein
MMDTDKIHKANMESQSTQFWLQLDLYQIKQKMYQATLVFAIFLMLFYASGYNNTSVTKI